LGPIGPSALEGSLYDTYFTDTLRYIHVGVP
jgi:hypothetical protein